MFDTLLGTKMGPGDTTAQVCCWWNRHVTIKNLVPAVPPGGHRTQENLQKGKN